MDIFYRSAGEFRRKVDRGKAQSAEEGLRVDHHQVIQMVATMMCENETEAHEFC